MKKSLLTTLILLAFSGSASAYSAGGGYVSNGFQDERNKSHGTQVAIGLHSYVYATNGTALGRNAHVLTSAMGGTALGRGARVEASGALAIQDATAKGIRSVAIGGGATAKGINSVAIGGGSSTDGNYSIAMGSSSKTTNGGIAIGTITSATGGDAISLGKKANSSSNQGIAIGVNANTASNEDYLRIISLKQINLETNRLLSSFDSSLSQEEQQKISEQLADLERQKYEIQNALEEAKSSNQKSSPNQISIGSDAISGNDNAIAIGSSAHSGIANGVALGSSSMANTEAGVVGYLANGETSSTWQSTFGALSIGDVANDITRQITGLAAGTEDTDAVNVAQLKVMKTMIDGKADKADLIPINENIANNALAIKDLGDSKADKATVNKAMESIATNFGGGSQVLADGTMAAPSYTITDFVTGKEVTYNNVGDALGQLNTNQNALGKKVDNLSGAVNELRSDIHRVRREAHAGTALAMAVANLGQPYKPAQTAFGMSSAIYKGRVGLAAGVSRITENGKFLFKGALAGNNDGQIGGAVSATYYFD